MILKMKFWTTMKPICSFDHLQKQPQENHPWDPTAKSFLTRLLNVFLSPSYEADQLTILNPLKRKRDQLEGGTTIYVPV